MALLKNMEHHHRIQEDVGRICQSCIRWYWIDMTNAEILSVNQDYILQIDKIDKVGLPFLQNDSRILSGLTWKCAISAVIQVQERQEVC